MKSIILVSISLFFMNQITVSQNWTGNVSSDWNNVANWSSAPTSGTAIIINPINYSGAAVHPEINTNSIFTPETIEIMNGGQLTVNANISTSDNLEITNPGSVLILNSGAMQVGNRLIVDLGSQMVINNGNLNVNQRFITGDGSITTMNNGNVTTGQRLLLDLGGIFYFHDGIITVGETMALADGNISSSCLFHMTGGTLSVNGELELENESGVFEPVFKMDGGTLNLNGDLIWFGEIPGSGTPKVLLNGGIANITGLIQNFPLSTVNMYLRVDGNAILNFSGSLIENLYLADSIVQSGNSEIHFIGSNTFLNEGVFHADSGLINFAGTTNIQGAGSYQFHNLTIESQGIMNHLNPQIIRVSGNLTQSGLLQSNLNTVEFNGLQLQTLTGTGSYVLHNVNIENTSQEGVVFQIPVNVNNHLQLNNGIVHTSAASLLEMDDNSTIGGESNISFVSGPMTKTGDDPFTFPVGKNNKLMQISIGAPNSPSVQFLAEYFNDSFSTLMPVNSPLSAVSNIEYWNLEQLSGNSSPEITLYWNDAFESAVSDCNELTIAYWNNNTWVNISSIATGTCSGNGNGTVSSNSGVSDVGVFSFGFFSGVTSQNITICSGDSLVVGSSVYYNSGHYMDVLTDSTLNDSIVLTYLDVIVPDAGVAISGFSLQSNNVNADSFQWVDCNNNFIPLQGEISASFTPTETGSYALVVNDQGCVAISECFTYLFEEHMICEGDSLIVGNSIYHSTGIFVDIVQQPQLNDSIIVVTDLTVFTPDVSVSVFGNVLHSNNLNAGSYQWVDCNNNFAAISGETNFVFAPSVNGSYALIVSENGCTDTSECYQITILDIIDPENENNFQVFPNPFVDEISIIIPEEMIAGSYSISITDLQGAELFRKQFDESVVQMNLRFDPTLGMYIIKFENVNFEKYLKIIKN